MEKRNDSDKLWDSYFFDNTNVLKNKLNIIDYNELKKREAEISFQRLVELYENPINGIFDVNHLKNIHKYIFNDLYDWAGEFRYVDMQKETGFTSYTKIEEQLNYELNLMNEEIKSISNAYGLSSFLATYYSQLIIIHPFREGNGRSIREFLREFVYFKTKDLPCGQFELDWSKFNGEVMLNNIQFSLVFRGAIENEFRKSLEQLTIDSQIKK